MTDPKTAEVLLDIAYFRNKLANTKDSYTAERLRTQIKLLEDAAVIYQLTSPTRD
jgi:hypothetical protein